MTHNQNCAIGILQKFQIDFKDSAKSDIEIFQKIAKLDKDFENNEEYQYNINGAICNLGMDRGSIKLLNFAKNRLKKMIEKNANGDNKQIYDLGNLEYCIGELKNPHPHSIQSLLDSNHFNEARGIFNKVNQSYFYKNKSLINSANILEKYGRNLEAIYLYDEALKENPRFGMALGNKALALKYYITLAPNKSIPLISLVSELYKKALLDESLEIHGGYSVRTLFQKELSYILDYLKSQKQQNIDIHKKPIIKSKYLTFCLDRNLFLNWDFGFYHDEQSLTDNFFPQLIELENEEKTKHTPIMSRKIYFSFYVFNEVLEAYATARLNYFKIIQEENKYDEITNYINMLDYTKHSYSYGSLKIIFTTLYNCLDKIGHLISYCFMNLDEGKNFYLSQLLDDEFKEVILKNNNYHLLALRSLALDFSTNQQYHYLNKIRNRITHSYLGICNHPFESKEKDFTISIEHLFRSTEKMFLIVKAALMYTINAINSEKEDFRGTIPSISIPLERDLKF